LYFAVRCTFATSPDAIFTLENKFWPNPESYCRDPAASDVVAAIAELTHGEGAHKTLDASSAPDARAAAVRSVRAWGTACFVGERGQVEDARGCRKQTHGKSAFV
jgi:threonine dehydrogenase-like Zn-dependent dehydrogenase